MKYKEVVLEQGSDAWLIWRGEGIGASDASAIMGENRYKSREDLLREKIYGSVVKITEAMQEGTRMEPQARLAYQKSKGLNVEPLCVESIEYPWLKASLDGISENRDAIVEIKCGKSAMRIAQQGEIPGYYYGQIQHQLMITGLDKIDYWCYRPESGGILLETPRNDKYIHKLFRAELEFYNAVSASARNRF